MISSVRLENIYKNYGLDQFSLSVGNLDLNNQHIQVIVGPNGSGKSTLLNLLAFLDTAERGKIVVDGKGVFPGNNGKNKLRKRIGFLRQSPYLFNLDVFENIALGLRIRKRTRAEINSRVTDILSTLQIGHLRARRIRSLSRGEFQKVAIAQVLVIEPEIMLMDEPTASIDEQSVLSIEQAIKSIQKKINSLVVMTTHSLSQAYRISPDIISIREGRVVGFVHENVFFGQIKDVAGGLQGMQVSEGMEIVFSTKRRGKSYIAIDPEDIIVSKEAVITSARNVFSGNIIKMESLGPNIRLLINIGVPIYSVITKQSFKEMNVSLNTPVYLSFKVNSVEVI